jgi:hypothetical protein
VALPSPAKFLYRNARAARRRPIRGRRLHDEGEALVRKRGDHDRNRQTGLHALRLGVERLAEFHDVQTALTERGADGRRRVSLARRDLQLDIADNFLCHDGS